MFWKRKEGEAKVEAGPKKLPNVVTKYLVEAQKKKPDWVAGLNAVMRPRDGTGVDIRIFDPTEALVKEIKIDNWTTLDAHPGLVIYEGWFDENAKEKAKRVELTQKKEVAIKDIPIFTADEVRQKIEALSVPGSFVYFYVAGSPCYGGPLGRGAAGVELNPNQEAKQKKYIVYVTNIDGMEPVGKRQEMFRSDKIKEVVSWIKEKHYKSAV